MRALIRCTALVVATFLATALGNITPCRAADAPAKPNVIVLLSDDVGYGEFGFQGCKDIPTPNIDSIAQNGIRFTNGYVSGPYCSPTRAGLLTGRYQTRFGHEWNEGKGTDTFGLPLTQTTFAQRMKSLGYATCAIGKWHLGYEPQFRPTKRGFDEYYGTLGNTPYYHPQLLDSRKGPDPVKVKDDAFYTTDAYAARAVEWIDAHQSEPFFLYLPFNAQHAPLQAPQKYLDRFPEIKDENRKLFAGMMAGMDDAVGQVLSALRKHNLEERTLIFFFSDNGGPTPTTTSQNGPLRGVKMTTLEGGVRVPFLAQWKGRLPAGKTYDKPAIQLDLLPTAIAAAGGEVGPDAKLDGVNLLPFLEALGGNAPVAGQPHETLFWRLGPQWAVRSGDWKLVAARPDKLQPKLFNLKDDIGEKNDLSSKEPQKVAELKALWDKWNAENEPARWVPEKVNANKKQPAKDEA